MRTKQKHTFCSDTYDRFLVSRGRCAAA
jgi:hypothetical protein